MFVYLLIHLDYLYLWTTVNNDAMNLDRKAQTMLSKDAFFFFFKKLFTIAQDRDLYSVDLLLFITSLDK